MSRDRPPPPEEAQVVRQGYLRRLKTMKRKYFVLKSESRQSSARLEYYDSEKKFRLKAPPKRAIPLKSCFNINRRLDTKHKHVIALYTKEESFCVVLESEEELRAWLHALLALHNGNEDSDERQYPEQHVWTVNVQKKGLGASKGIIGLYNLCLTDKHVSLTKIKPNNNLQYDSYAPDSLDYALRNIRRCGNSECFFYMEVGRQTLTGAGELWMHVDDNNIASSMHTTILRAMKNCTKDSTDKDLAPTYRDRSMSANDATTKPSSVYNRRQTLDGKVGLSPSNEKGKSDAGICVACCLKTCDSSSASYCIDRPHNIATESTREASMKIPSNSSLELETGGGGCEGRQFPPAPPAAAAALPRIAHARTRSLPLAGDEPLDKPAERVAGEGRGIKAPPAWLSRRASTGCRLAKWSPAHPKNGTTAVVRSRCDSMPSRVPSRAESDAERVPSRTPSQHLEDVGEMGSDSVDGGMEWTPVAHRTPRIPEEPDQATYCEMVPPVRRLPIKISSTHHSRNSSLVEDASPTDGYLPMAPCAASAGPGGDTGYVDMHAGRASSPAASSSSVASGTPSTDVRFIEYHLDPVSAVILDDQERPIPRAYSVGSRPTTTQHSRTSLTDTSRTRAFSVGSKSKMRPIGHAPPSSHVTTPTITNKTSSAPLLAPRSSADTLCDDLMELDFSNNQSSPRTRPPPAYPLMARTPPTGMGLPAPAHASTPRPVVAKVDEYVDMSPSGPRVSGYVEMKASERGLTPTSTEASVARSPPLSATPSIQTPATPDGYVEMNYSKRPDTNRVSSRPILIDSDVNRQFGLQSSTLSSVTDSERSTPRATPLLSPLVLGRNGPIGNSRNAKKFAERQRRNSKDSGTPISAQTIFSLSLDSPASPSSKPVEDERELEADDVFGDCSHFTDVVGTTLSTVREMNEEGARKSQDLAESPCEYVVLKLAETAARSVSLPIAARGKIDSDTSESEGTLLSSNPTATKTLTRKSNVVIRVEDARPSLIRAASGPGALFTPVCQRPETCEPPTRKSSSPKPVESALNRALRGDAPTPPPLNYASLDLEPPSGASPSPTPTPRPYTQIDFARSEKLNTIDTN